MFVTEANSSCIRKLLKSYEQTAFYFNNWPADGVLWLNCPGKKYGYCEVMISLGETRLKSSRLSLDMKGILLLMLYDKIIPDRLFVHSLQMVLNLLVFSFMFFVGIPLRALSLAVKCEEISCWSNITILDG